MGYKMVYNMGIKEVKMQEKEMEYCPYCKHILYVEIESKTGKRYRISLKSTANANKPEFKKLGGIKKRK